MAIKLKNNDREDRTAVTGRKRNGWGLLFAFLVILAAAAGMMVFYPVFKTQLFAGASKITEYMLEQNQFEGYVTQVENQWYSFGNYWELELRIVGTALGIGSLVTAAAFIIALIKPLDMSSRLLFRAPFELVALIGGLFFVLMIDSGYNLTEMTIYSVMGEMGNMFCEELYFTPGQAETAVWLVNFFVWAALAFVLYWLVTCCTSVFTMGFVRCCRERTITGRLLRWCFRLFKKTYNLVESVDFNDKSTRWILKIVGINFLLLTVISCFWFFGIFGLIVYSVVLFFVLRKNYFAMQEKYQILLRATGELGSGNLDVEIKEDLGLFEPFRGEIEKIQIGFKKAVDEEVKSQSMKTELITNVSHDLKTPLTAIITYVNLLKKDGITEEERNSYIQVLDLKSMRLKSLIEDLFEVSKATTRNVTLNMVDMDIVSLMKQVRLELDDKIQGSGIDFKWNLPESRIVLNLDSEKTYRVFENLLVNIVNYAMPGTRAYVDIEEKEEEVCISMKNISATEISLNGFEISERFVRGDSSRNTEGSGLGLAIAKSFVELQKGRFDAEIEADLFKVRITFQKCEQAAE